MTLRPSLLILVLGVLGGCQSGSTSNATTQPTSRAAGVRPAVAADPAPLPAGRRLLRVHRLRLANGGGGELAGRVDDSRLDAETRDQLWANGLRIGVGEATDLAVLADFAAAGDVETRAVVGSFQGGPQRFDMPMPDDARTAQERPTTLLWHGPDGVGGRTFGPGSLDLAVTFSAAPGGAGRVTRLGIVPRVASRRALTRFLPSGGDGAFGYPADESIDVASFHVDVPDGGFVVVAASPEADRETSIGHAFLRGGDGAGEVAIVIVPDRAEFRAVRKEPAEARR